MDCFKPIYVDFKRVDAFVSDSNKVLSNKSEVDNFPKMSFEPCIQTCHAMMNCGNHTISQYGVVCYIPSFLSENNFFHGIALVGWMFNMSAWLRNVQVPFCLA